MFWHYDHRWATIESENPNEITVTGKSKPDKYTLPRYWISAQYVEQRLNNCGWKRDWMMCYRAITNATNERSVVVSVLPRVGAGNNAPVLITNNDNPRLITCLMANLNSLVLDYVARLKIGGVNLNVFIVEQFPVLSPDQYNPTNIDFIAPRVLELVYTAYDLKPFAEDMEFHGNPYRWDEDRRAVLRADLDAYYARLYGLNRKQLRYILDPADLTPRELENILDPWEEVADPLDPVGYAQRVAANDFPGETFRVLKDKEIRQYGEYRTRRLVLEAWDRLEGVDVGNPDGYPAQGAAVPPKQETVSVAQPRPESRPAAVRTQFPAPAKPSLSVTPPDKVVKEIDPPADQPTLTDFGLYKCEVCGKMVMGFEKVNHEQEKHGGKSVQWKKVG